MEATTRAAVQPSEPSSRPEHWRWNFATLGGDIAVFTLGLSISSAQTILPLFVHRLTASNEAVALIAAVRNLGILAPQLFVAPLAERLRRAKPLIMTVTVFERLPFLALALGALWLAGGQRLGLLLLFYAMVFVQQLAGGITYPAWLDLIARTIPDTWRGRFMGVWLGIGGLAGIGGAALAAALVARVLWPLNFALVFALTFVAFIISFALLALSREPPRPLGPPAQDQAARMPDHTSQGAWRLGAAVARTRTHSRELAQVLAHDAGLRWLVAANAAAGMATMAGALFAVAALQRGGLSAAQVGAESTVLIVATTAGSFIWGAVADHFGHRWVLVGSAACTAGAAALAVVAQGFALYAAVFLLLGLSLSASLLAQLTFVTVLAPPARRPTYIAVVSVAYAPFAVLAPIFGGWLADRSGYTPVFVLSVVFALLAIAAYRLRVPEPSRLPSPRDR